jgi:hypothetical protein
VSDRLELADAIVAAGIERNKAGRLASTIVDLIHDEVATPADVAAVRGGVQSAAAVLGADIAATRFELKADIAAVEAKLTRIEHRC